jgi:hypothetical protein
MDARTDPHGTPPCPRIRLSAPLCAQCRGPMIIVVCEPDFENSMMATYRCAECGLLDRAQIQ